MCLVRGPGTAQVLASIFIGINNFFSGLIVRPQQMVGRFWEITYWICPGKQKLIVIICCQHSIAARKMIKPPSLLFDLLHVFILKGHFVYEGLTMSVFSNDNRKVIVGQGSDYYDPLNCSDFG